MKKLIAQGAEAKIHLLDNKILKERIVKSYRHPVLDEQIRKSRTKRESKILIKAKEAGVNVPKVLNADKKGIPKDKYNLEIEFIEGDKLSETLNSYKKEKQFEVMEKLGKQVSILHEKDIIHGDLTTSNVIFSEDKIFIIDFGLGFISLRLEDKAVDLHLIKQALEAKHWQNWERLFKQFLEGYVWEKSKEVLEQLKKVEARGRYRH
ncbi:Kae1-associated serine/threonine protein kinase [archaeon]|nr:Kae1-associated serine/threonine protein kinase [archaeon]